MSPLPGWEFQPKPCKSVPSVQCATSALGDRSLLSTFSLKKLLCAEGADFSTERFLSPTSSFESE